MTVTIAGRSSGVSPTASATEKSSESIVGRPSRRFAVSTAKTMTSIVRTSIWPKWRTPRANSVSGARWRSRSAIAPKSVARPV